MANWTIINNHLALKENDSIYHPSAKEIYSLPNTESILDGKECIHPSLELPQLRFSKIGSEAKIYFTNDANGQIIAAIKTFRKGAYINLDIINGKIIDHCIYDNTWFYITGNINYLQEIINYTEIKESGIITLKQYLKIIEKGLFQDNSFIINNVDNLYLHKPIVENQDIPSSLKATLFPYQKNGFLWLRTMLETNNGCILGDEMGLGKTMQVIAELLHLKSLGEVPVLVIAPISLLINWERECAKFAPSLKTHIHYGENRTGNYQEFLKYDVIITAYSTIVSDIFMLNMITWKLVVLDEAQCIKNPDSSRTRTCKKIKRVRSLAVSGTPFENHITDIWSLLDFVQPGLLGTKASYESIITDDTTGAEKIEPILSALMVRRLVCDVAKDLPDKVISTQPLQMSDIESQQYINYLNILKNSHNVENITLGMLQQLRIYCTHPYAIEEENSYIDPASVSIKYQRLCEIVEEIISRKEKVLVFTSFKNMFNILKSDIPKRFGIKVWSINGETDIKERQQIVDAFNNHDTPAMLVLNPRAAGTGLNITGANHVIHYNLEWNPSLEDQSSARAYRRGQERTVFIYRLYYTNTIEQVINERIERKRDIAQHAIVGNDGESQDRADIIKALELIPTFGNFTN